jgi:CheY-like chemotaxis protein
MPNDVEILLVEDNTADAELTLHSLRKENLANRVVRVEDGEQALDFLFCRGPYAHRSITSPPKVVLLDLKMPKVDGLEVLRVMKSDPQTRCIPVVVMTSSGEEKDLVNSYRLGVNSYLQKPVEFDQFREVVKQLGLYWLLVNAAPPPASFVPP